MDLQALIDYLREYAETYAELYISMLDDPARDDWKVGYFSGKEDMCHQIIAALKEDLFRD